MVLFHGTYKKYPHNLGKVDNTSACLKENEGLHLGPERYDSIHVNKCLDTEHGRNHLITSL